MTPDALVSASLCSTAVVKSVQGAGLGSGLGEVAGEREPRGGQRSDFEAGYRPASGCGLMGQSRCEEDG